jgi:hypothetical protein
MQTNTALGGWQFKLTRNSNFYFGPRRVSVTDPVMLERIREAVDADEVFLLRSLFEECGGNIRA